MLGVLKIDMDKAYNRINWNFIKTIPECITFSQHWFKLIIECIGTVSYPILINGSPSGIIKPSRGLRQGDPFSPYIFILCQNILSQLLFKAEEQNDK